ncbi:MAG: DUF2917 domain-containing protein [Betaproteobacteria bacterium]
MTCYAHDRSIDLAASAHLTLDNACGTPLRVTRGTLWVTQEASYEDVILHAGDQWTIERQGRTVIQAHEEARLCVPASAAGWTQARHERIARWRRRLQGTVRASVAGWLCLRAKRVLPYY